MDGVVLITLDPRSLALLAMADVLPMVDYPFALPMEVWRRLTGDRSDPVAFALHGWFEAHRSNVRLLDPGAAAPALGEHAAIAVLTEDQEVRSAINARARQAVIAVSAIDILQALETGHRIHSAAAVAATAGEALMAWREAPVAPLDQMRLTQRLLANLDIGVLSLA